MSYIHVLCSLCGTDDYTTVRRRNAQGEKVLDVCHCCNFSIQKTITRQNIRARQNGIDSRLKSAQWIEILQQSQGYCAYCKVYEGCNHLVPDHIIPLCKGGTNDPENIAAACVFCNSGKHTKSAEWWREEIRKGYYQRPGVTFVRSGVR